MSYCHHFSSVVCRPSSVVRPSTFHVLGWPPFKIVSGDPDFQPRWPLLLKIEISLNGQNCSILSQNVPKFELYKHNDELFNIYYRIFYELWTFADFDRLCKLEKRGDEILKNLLLWNYWANINQILLKWLLDGPLPNLCPLIPTFNQDGRQAKNRKRGDEILIVHCCFSVSQNELKF